MKTVRNVKIDFNERKHRFSLTVLFSVVIFIIQLAAIGIAAIVMYFLTKLEVIDIMEGPNSGPLILFMSIISLVIGSTIAMILGKIPLGPINKLVNGMNSLAAGNFKTRLEYGRLIGTNPTFNEITESFNTLAEELENTEMLRSDFINNFSHEFKTPIVSIAGLAKLLKKGNLSEEQKKLYLDAIEEESMRLSYMATNVLNMTKVENQTILTDVSRYNLSEQVRSAVLLLERNWTRKNVDLQLDFDEFDIEANEELLKQVWINLVDNAVKFVPRCGTISLEVVDAGENLRVMVSNTGKEIPKDKQDKIFNKFYQADESHAQEGNGIGLAIVKRIVELHEGTISVKSENGMTTFTVELPKKQSS